MACLNRASGFSLEEYALVFESILMVKSNLSVVTPARPVDALQFGHPLAPNVRDRTVSMFEELVVDLVVLIFRPSKASANDFRRRFLFGDGGLFPL